MLCALTLVIIQASTTSPLFRERVGTALGLADYRTLTIRFVNYRLLYDFGMRMLHSPFSLSHFLSFFNISLSS
jgi:hypothetical protein